MPVFQLNNEIFFPPPDFAEEDGLLAVGGDLTTERLMTAYSMGIFPWYSDGSPILWWSPDPRFVLIPEDFRLSRSLKQTMRKRTYHVTFDADFEGVIRNCASVPRKGEAGTWITDDMINAYLDLHRVGYAHSVETWHEGILSGGLYGVALGRAFFGESMFSLKSDASKVALAGLVSRLVECGYLFLDCQMTTGHLAGMGAKEMPRDEFLKLLKNALSSGPDRSLLYREGHTCPK